MNKLDLCLLRWIKHAKGQFISVTVVIALALCIYISFSMTAINMRNTVDYYYKITKLSDIQVQLVRIPQDSLSQLYSIPEVDEVQGRISMDVPLKVQDKNEKVRVRMVSSSEGVPRVNDLYMLKGKKTKGGTKSAVVLEQFANARGIKTGDRINPYINGMVHSLNVTGIAASSEYIYLMENEQALLPAPEKFGVIYVDEGFAQSVFGYQDSYNEVLVRVRNPQKINETVDEVEKLLDKYGIKRIIKKDDQLSNRMLTEEIRQMEKMSTAIPFLFLIVAAVIISIMLSRIVRNDRTNIGVLKALGYGNLRVMTHYIKYALMIGFAGAIVGIAGGIFVSGLLAKIYIQYYNLPLLRLDIYYIYILYAFILTGTFCVLSGLAGARSVVAIMPADSMRPEAPKAGRRIFLERIDFIWRRITFSWKMVIRNMVRSRKRFVFLVLGMALSYAINTVPVFLGDSMMSMFSLHYGEFQRMDYTVEFSKPMTSGVINELKHIINVKTIEPKLEFPFEIQNGWRKKVVSIVGIPDDTVFYEFKNRENKIMKLPSKGMFLSEGLAKELGLKKGDTVTIKNFIPGKDDIQVQISGINKQYLGMNGYMNIHYMQEMLADKKMITGVSFYSQDDVNGKLQNIQNISSIQSIEEMQNMFLQYLDSVVYSVGIMMLFGGILGFAIIYNATIISISERNMEFSSLRVMGFDKMDIFNLITKENSIITFVAIILGIPIGWAMCKGIAEAFNTEMYTIPAIITMKTFIFAAFGTICFVALAQLATLKKIYGLNFIEALKNRVS